ncbi:MAG: EAL domain-containing protein [Gammaproteobacteria bacterium]|nr:EAL domain-containing protein [Gammaproteobacteria bacterium]
MEEPPSTALKIVAPCANPLSDQESDAVKSLSPISAPSDLQRHDWAAPTTAKGLNIRRFYSAINAILVVGFISYTIGIWFDVRQQVRTELEHINGLFGQAIESVFRHHETVLRILGQRFLDIDAANNPERGRRLVENLMELNPAFAGFGLAQPNGQLLLVSGIPAGRPLPNLLAQTESTATFLKVFDTNRLVIGRSYHLPLLDSWLIPIRIAVKNSSDHLKLVMTAGLSIESERAIWNALKLPQGMQITLLRHDGFIQLRLPTTVEDKHRIYDDPVSDSHFTARHAPLTADPFRNGSLAVADWILEGSMRSYASYPRTLFWTRFVHQLLLPLLLFSSAFLLALALFYSFSRNQRRYEAHLLHQAHFDALTMLPNRTLALDRLAQMIEEAKRNTSMAAVLFLDLDEFKRVNDGLGHNVGDEILVETARRLLRSVRARDTVARLGGDEFIVILGDLDSVADVQSVAEKLLRQFHEPFICAQRELGLTASIGIALYPDNGKSAAELLRRADTAMYHSKQHGRRLFHFFTDEMNRVATRHLALEEQLRGALERNELYLEYQPLVDLQSGCMAGAEALLRWHNGDLGQVTPDEFIPIAEQSGLIVPIGRYVLQSALTTLAGWHRSYGSDLKIAVNLSPRQFRDPQLIAFIRQSLNRAGVAAEQLELEITEGVLISKYVQTDAIIDDLKAMGVAIAMDDFGTGYSSLSYLRNHPFDTLKIDRGFVAGISEERKDRELVNAIINTAQSLGLKVVAEGVENEVQLHYLRAQGCDLAQGYHFSRPLSATGIESWLKASGQPGTPRIVSR